MATIRLGQIARARSGDKGSSANIGVIARHPAAYEFLRTHLSEQRVAGYFAQMRPKTVKRYEWPNLGALNFVLADILDGGGSVSLRVDAQGKALAQALLEMTLDVPDSVIGDTHV